MVSSFWTRQRERVVTLGLPRTVGYLVGAAAERFGIGIWVSFAFLEEAASIASYDARFAVLHSMAEWSTRDLEILRDEYTLVQLQFFNVLFEMGNFCVVARCEQSELACICWIENIGDYYFAKGRQVFRIHACYTMPTHRGKGLYPQTLAFACGYLQSTNTNTPIVIDTSVLNAASKKGIVKAGFIPIGKFMTVRKWTWGWQTHPALSLGADNVFKIHGRAK